MYRYHTVSEIHRHPEGPSYEAYGIVCIEGEGEDARQVAYVSDVSCDGTALAALVALCNEEELSPLHLVNVVDDWLYEQEFPLN